MGLQVVVHVAPGDAEIAPAKGVAEAQHGLPCQIRIACSHVEVERHDPVVISTVRQAALHADDRVPLINRGAATAGARWRCNWAEVSCEFPAEILLEAGEPRTGQPIERCSGTREAAVAAAERPYHALQIEIRCGLDAARKRLTPDLETAGPRL